MPLKCNRPVEHLLLEPRVVLKWNLRRVLVRCNHPAQMCDHLAGRLQYVRQEECDQAEGLLLDHSADEEGDRHFRFVRS